MDPTELVRPSAVLLPPADVTGALSSVDRDVNEAARRGILDCAVRSDDLRTLLAQLDDDRLSSGERAHLHGALDNSRQRGGSHAAITVESGLALIAAVRRKFSN